MKENTLSNQNVPNHDEKSSMALDTVPFAGITNFSTVDYPGNLAAVLYTQGCPMRCRYCQNPEFWDFHSETADYPAQEVADFLMERKGFLDAVVFSGGEPTAHENLGDWMALAKSMGYKIGLHTSGAYPDRLKEWAPLCDWISMDVKAPFGRYSEITQVKKSGLKPKESVEVIVRSGVDHEFHTVYHPALLTREDLLQIAGELSRMKVKKYSLRGFHPEGCPDETLYLGNVSREIIPDELEERLHSLFENFSIIY